MLLVHVDSNILHNVFSFKVRVDVILIFRISVIDKELKYKACL
jgi:hypothetical protein